jgi:hypothetical protein
MQHGLIEWQMHNKSVPLMRFPDKCCFPCNPIQLEAAGNGLATATALSEGCLQRQAIAEAWWCIMYEAGINLRQV